MKMSTHTEEKKILVVDDESQVCQSVAKVLKRKGYQVEQAFCVSDALEMMEQGKRLDLVIADLMMPQAGGMELLKISRDRWPEIPVVIITGYASIQTAVDATRQGAAGYIPKPFTPEELEEAVEKVVVKGPWNQPAREEGGLEGVIDVDIPFDSGEVARATSPSYVEHLTRSDLPLVAPQAPRPAAADFCDLGGRCCKRFQAKGVCKQPECPLVVAERRKNGSGRIVGPMVSDPIDVDLPFGAGEVAAATSEAYMLSLGREDMPNLGYWPAVKAYARRILVVDDEAVVVNSIRRSLIRKGYLVDEAFTGRSALTRILAEDYDLVILDMRMPDMNGLELMPKGWS
jgi:CheY-like chemotaxis protein